MNNKILAIDIGSTKICTAIAEIRDNEPHVIGYGKQKSQGIKKGMINNIELAAQAIKNAINESKRMAGVENLPSAIVSLSGSYTKSFNSSAVVNVANNEITIKEVTRVLETALYNSTVPSDHEVIHILPFRFKLDDQDYVEDPIGMAGSRFEAFVHIVTVKKTSIDTFKKTINAAGVEIDNIVLSSYASSLSTLIDEEKELGAACIDMGGESCNIMIYLGNSMRANYVLPVGSEHINNDIALAFNTTKAAAEEIKIKHIDLAGSPQDLEGQLEIPYVGKPGSFLISKEMIWNTATARVTETFSILHGFIQQSGLQEQIGALVLTGGMTKLNNIIKIAEMFFKLPIRIAKPIEIKGLNAEELNDESNAVVIGLILYGIGKHTNYERDSKKIIRHKISKTYNEIVIQDNDTHIHTDLSNLSNNFPKNEKNMQKSVIIHNKKKSLAEAFKGMLSKLF
ncbi:cell division protein FtsA [Helicobacter anatolicus]|uniref:cell division protein FtsA n=1 Tax=Helicobacter anatolicus TaxID=2905874 RepID=UPI001E62F6BE|nr:cell division protein FtsA [Helicobacter anatolicus]MCE3039233.1 cell division protein FtsA [Helicobacter anatolicus]